MKDNRYIKDYWRYLKPHFRLLLMAFLVIPVITSSHLAQPFLLKIGIDQHILKGDRVGLVIVASLFGFLVILEFLCKALQNYLFQTIGQRSIADIRQDLFTHVTGFSMSYFDRTPQGQITSKLTSDIESLNDSFTSGVVTLIGDMLTIVGILVIMFIMSPKLTFITLLVVPPVYLTVNFCRKRLRYFYTKIRTTMGQLNATLQEQLEGIPIIQLFQRETTTIKTFTSLNNTYKNATLGSVYYDAFLYSTMEAMSTIVVALMIWYGWGQFQEGAITIGLLVAFIDYIHKFFQPLKDLSNKFAVLQHALAALEKIFGTFAISAPQPSGNRQLAHFNQIIRFDDVSFTYPGFPDKPVLKNISFTIQPGETVALVGPTGSGKTSVGKLLNKFYTGYTGSITIDDISLDEIDFKSLQNLIAPVSQDIQLFSLSAKFNIGMGNNFITDSDIIRAAQSVHADPFIQSLPQKYDTVLQGRGETLSSGQAQLIAFARAMASPAPFIVLDEATASIDSLSEQLIQEAIETVMKEKTVLVIAHRLSTIQKADKILALKNGELVEAGTHQELIAKDGFYAKLYQMQFSQ